jgi:hypothetical protein
MITICSESGSASPSFLYRYSNPRRLPSKPATSCLFLPIFLRWDSWHPIDEERIAVELEVTLDELRKALAALVLHGLILHDDAHYRIPVWRLSSVWGAKGSWREVQADIAGEADWQRDADGR